MRRRKRDGKKRYKSEEKEMGNNNERGEKRH